MVSGHDSLVVLHTAAGAVALALGPLALMAERRAPHQSAAGAAYHWAVMGVALTALGLVAYDVSALWWLAPLAVLSYGLALLGYRAPTTRRGWWVRAYAHGQGGSYIALVTALLVVLLEGWAAVAAWIVPTLAGLPLIERRVSRINKEIARSEVHQ